ncbi:MAG: PHP domain-containing protein [Desulfuromonadaceae bacterium]|nr:PHP domain-containing protein [Desulfuromonadaceae bacterium]
MMPRVDLHVHSCCSDGVYSPRDLVALAANAGIRVLALCDHDNIDGVLPAVQAGIELGVEVLSGVELSCVWNDYADVHLLGYGFDVRHEGLQQSLRDFQRFRARRSERMLEKINDLLSRRGEAPVALTALLERAGGSIGRPHLAMALMERGLVGTMEEAFRDYLIPCNEPKRFFPVEEAIALIRSAGGVAVLAHPPYITRDHEAMKRLLEVLAGEGLQGLEAYNNGVNCTELEWYLAQARYRKLLVTGGSDFHGIEEGNAELGRIRSIGDIPYTCVEQLQAALGNS